MDAYAVVKVKALRGGGHEWSGPPGAEVEGVADITEGLNMLFLRGWELTTVTTLSYMEGVVHYLFLRRAE
jgi:hypothetical protein